MKLTNYCLALLLIAVIFPLQANAGQKHKIINYTDRLDPKCQDQWLKEKKKGNYPPKPKPSDMQLLFILQKPVICSGNVNGITSACSSVRIKPGKTASRSWPSTGLYGVVMYIFHKGKEKKHMNFADSKSTDHKKITTVYKSDTCGWAIYTDRIPTGSEG